MLFFYRPLLGWLNRWRVEHGEPPTEEAVWDLHRLEQKSVEAETLRLERAEAEAAGEAPMPPSMVIHRAVVIRRLGITSYR